MIEDKLDKDQRIRLEALSQAIGSYMGKPANTGQLVTRAASFETFIKDGVLDNRGDER